MKFPYYTYDDEMFSQFMKQFMNSMEIRKFKRH